MKSFGRVVSSTIISLSLSLSLSLSRSCSLAHALLLSCSRSPALFFGCSIACCLSRLLLCLLACSLTRCHSHCCCIFVHVVIPYNLANLKKILFAVLIQSELPMTICFQHYLEYKIWKLIISHTLTQTMNIFKDHPSLLSSSVLCPNEHDFIQHLELFMIVSNKRSLQFHHFLIHHFYILFSSWKPMSVRRSTCQLVHLSRSIRP